MAGFDIVLAIDNWEDALVTYRQNHRHSIALNGDLLTLDPMDVEREYGLHDISVTKVSHLLEFPLSAGVSKRSILRKPLSMGI